MEIKRRQFHRRSSPARRREQRPASALVDRRKFLDWDRRTQDRRTRGDNFLGVRGSTRIPQRLPVRVGIKEGATFRDLLIVAWTLVLSKYGASMECKWPLDASQEVAVTVLTSEKRRGIGRVVWCVSNPNESGNFEVGVELREAEDLWGITFPSPEATGLPANRRHRTH